MSNKITSKNSIESRIVLKNLSDKSKLEEKRIKIFEECFNMILVGMTCCGKTYLLLDMLEKKYKGIFENIFLICPTYTWNKTYTDWK